MRFEEFLIPWESLEHNLRHDSSNNTFLMFADILNYIYSIIVEYSKMYVIKHSNHTCYLII